jgi:hypothetical protein
LVGSCVVTSTLLLLSSSQPRAVDVAPAHERLQRADALLAELGAALGDRADLQRKVVAARAELGALKQTLPEDAERTVAPSDTSAAAATSAQPLEDGAFRDLFVAVRKQRLDRDRLRLLSAAAQGHQFFTYQVLELLRCLPAEKVKLQGARVLLQRPLMDPENSEELQGLFRMAESRHELGALIERTGGVGRAH